MPKNIIIAIDGVSSSGKSTLAKHIADAMHYEYIDSGAYYRVVTLFFSENNIDWKDKKTLKDVLNDIHIVFHYDREKKESKTLLNGRDVESEIRSMQISNLVSEVSTIPEVRNFIVGQLRKAGAGKNLVMDGRDIGTVVFPHAVLKIYLTANEKIRKERRFGEMKNKGVEVTENQIAQNLSDRDLTDSTRLDGPLRKADDAIVLDNSNMNEQEQFEFVLNLAQQKLLTNK